ncbi:MAG: ACP S-malonyltransferase [Candidatus Omnitrophica bacterium]|nr:ACP S-malonyltransferase [Candidatus Omnitrophota bacterium]
MTPVALIFPGQGAQFVGMGKDFYETSPEARDIFDRAEALVPDLKSVTFDGPAERLTSTAFCQPAIFTLSMAALAALKADPAFANFEPRYACGLSLGEYSALCAAGALDFEDTLRLVLKRGALMEEATKLQKGAMAAVIGFDKDQLAAICAETGAEVANFNAPDQIVITGDAQKVGDASAKIAAAGAKRVIPLDVSGAFHSSLMQPAAELFRAHLNSVSLVVPTFPILSNVDAQPVTETGHILNNLAEQITSSVQWVDSVRAIAALQVTTFLEIGPGTVLKGLIRKIDRELRVINIQKPADLQPLAEAAAG